MATLSDREVQELVDAKTSGTNHSAYMSNPMHKSIDHVRIYFYYMTEPEVKPEPLPTIYLYDAPSPLRNRGAVRRAIEDLAQNAAWEGIHPRPVATGVKFDFIKWTMRSLIVIVIDYPNIAGKYNWEFKEGAAIAFYEDGVHTPNHTFYDAFHHTFDISDKQGKSKRVSALCFENHMAGADRLPLGAGEEKFKYDLYAGPDGRFLPHPIDPGGTNLGPPPDVP